MKEARELPTSTRGLGIPLTALMGSNGPHTHTGMLHVWTTTKCTPPGSSASLTASLQSGSPDPRIHSEVFGLLCLQMPTPVRHEVTVSHDRGKKDARERGDLEVQSQSHCRLAVWLGEFS
jgi:hypothetical protein